MISVVFICAYQDCCVCRGDYCEEQLVSPEDIRE